MLGAVVLFRRISHGASATFVAKTTHSVAVGPYRMVRNPTMWVFAAIPSPAPNGHWQKAECRVTQSFPREPKGRSCLDGQIAGDFLAIQNCALIITKEVLSILPGHAVIQTGNPVSAICIGRCGEKIHLPYHLRSRRSSHLLDVGRQIGHGRK